MSNVSLTPVPPDAQNESKRPSNGADLNGNTEWTAERGAARYQIHGWGAPYFHVNARGHVEVRPNPDRPERVINLFELAQELKARGTALPVIVMTGNGDISVAVAAMKAGAVDFIEKPFEKAVLVAALTDGFARISKSGHQAERTALAVVRLEALTPRERDVLRGLVDGLPNKSIAYDLGLSPRTVEIHRAHLMSRLGVQSLSEALRIAFAAGWADPTVALK